LGRNVTGHGLKRSLVSDAQIELRVKQPHVSGLARICGERGVYVKGESMASKQPTPTVRELIGDVAPKLTELSEDVLFGDIWERPGLSKRDRSLITLATLVALNRTEQLPFHLRRALEHGIREDEIIELITHLAFYSGWPTAMSAVLLAKDVFQQDE
jgi:4-carboxymuconolactone decarboxylase